MRDYLQGKRCMVWSFMGNTRMYQALRDYGDRLDTVGIFTFEVDATGTISETGTSISTMLTYINKWPHIKWMLTVMNHGTASIFTALRNNTDGAKDTFLTELVRIMEKYPWCAGVDIDLERGGEYENRTAANALFKDIYNPVKAETCPHILKSHIHSCNQMQSVAKLTSISRSWPSKSMGAIQHAL